MLIKKNSVYQVFVALVIALASLFLGLYPFITKHSSLFFNMDPDPMYVGSALQFLQTGRISFMDHPGTPMISLISIFYIPIKLYVIYFLHLSNFSVWFLQNLNFIYLYTRIFLSSVLLAGLFIFHLAIYKKFKNILINLFFGMLLFLDQMHPGMYWAITPEILCFALTAVWYLLIDEFDEKGKVKNIYLASIVSGIIFATKMSFLFIPLAGFVYLIFKLKGSKSILKTDLRIFYKSILLSVLGFLVGVFPLWYKLNDLISYIFSYFIHTDKMGLGNVGIVNPALFKFSLLGLFNHPILLIVFLIFVIVAAGSIKNELLAKSILATSLVGFFAFMKYNDFHYQTANILLLSLAVSAFFVKIPNVYKILVMVILVLFFTDSINQNFKARRQIVGESYYLQSYIDLKNYNGKVVWDYARSRDYSILRSLRWTNFFFLNDFRIAYPNLEELNYSDLTKIFNYSGNDFEISKSCWQAIILQKSSWDKFIKGQENPSMFLKEDIPGTEMLALSYKNNVNCKAK